MVIIEYKEEEEKYLFLVQVINFNNSIQEAKHNEEEALLFTH